MHILKEKGWKVFGYKKDESDAMTDYFSPANWEGIAVKDGFVLLVDMYNTSLSGHEKKEKTYVADYSKIAKLKALRDDTASTQNEKASCDAQIKRIFEKEEKETRVIYEFPTFNFSNPGNSSWHIEKDGLIIAMGTGLYSCYETNKKGLQNEKLNSLIEKIEDAMTSDVYLKEQTKTTTHKTLKPIQIDKTILSIGDIVNFNNTRTFYKVTEATEKSYKFIRLGKKYQALKANETNFKYYTASSIHQAIKSEYVKVFTLKETVEKKEKTIYVKTKRPNQTNDKMSITATDENRWDISSNENQLENNQTEITLATETGPNKNGIELSFDGKPSEEIRELLKANGFRWNRRSKVWYAISNAERLLFANRLLQNDTDDNQDTNTSEEEKDFATEPKKKIAIKDITFVWSEAPNEIIEENKFVSSLKEANTIINKIAMHNLEGYTKTGFIIQWDDDSTHEGRIDVMRLHASEPNPLGDHVKFFINSLAGNNKPSNQTKEEYLGHLKAIYNVDESKMKEYADFLQTHELEESKESRTIEDIEDEIKKLQSEHSEAYDSFTRANHYNSESKLSLANSIGSKLKELKLEKLYLKSDNASQLFYSSLITKGQNARINLFANKYSDSKSVAFKAAYVNQSNPAQVLVQLSEDDRQMSYKVFLNGDTELLEMEQTNQSKQVKQIQSNYNLIENEVHDLKEKSKFPAMDIYDLETYIVSKELSERENSGHWVFRRKKRDHQQELKEYFQQLNNEIISILNETALQLYRYQLKKELQNFKKKYYNNYSRLLSHQANNPSWVVTGSAGRSRRKDEKALEQHDKLMRESIEIEENYKSKIASIKNKIKKEKKETYININLNYNAMLEF